MNSVNRWHSLPTEVFALVEHAPASVLLECGRPSAKGTRAAQKAHAVSRLFIAPTRVIAVNEPSEIPKLFAEIETAAAKGHFAAGFFTYECGNYFEPAARMRPAPPRQPLAWFGIYERSYLFDHESGAFVAGEPPGLSEISPDRKAETSAAGEQLDAVFGIGPQQYKDRIAAIHEWIRAGDVYQLNFTAPLHVRTAASPALLYARLAGRQPVEYGSFLHWQPGRHILSFSPELFFLLEQQGAARRITTRPMKGTAPRGRTAREDNAIADWLRNDPKNCAENVMIVDLLRNDLGRLCTFGSVKVESLFAVERYRTLWQMTSTVTGDLRPDVDFQQIFRALFPCGSVTGAPKVRAMQLLAELEEEPRGIYTGAIGFFSRERTVFNVAIRTLELENGQGRMGVGSGIVIDSDAAEEFRECELKTAFLTRPTDLFPQQFSLIETMLWQDGYPLIELHLDRLEDSASYFDFPCDRAKIKAALLAHAVRFTNPEAQPVPQQPRAPSIPLFSAEWVGDHETQSANSAELHKQPASQEPRAPSFPLFSAERVGDHETQSTRLSYKVRLLLDPSGNMTITNELLASPTRGDAQPARVRIATQRTDPRDPMLFHKTTHRPIYAEAFKAATETGYDDVLFLNIRGEVTESAIGNIFIEKNGKWFTPPLECGLLPGIYRRHILETKPEVQERILSIEDLRQADAIYLTNAVRGPRQVTIDWQEPNAGGESLSP